MPTEEEAPSETCRFCGGTGKITVTKYNPEDVDKYYHVTREEEEDCSCRSAT